MTLVINRRRVKYPKYRDVGKEIYQLEVPATTVVPKEYTLMSKTKTSKRYWTPTIRELVKEHAEWEERRNGALKNVYSNMLKQFSEYVSTWRLAVENVANIDCLLSLAIASDRMGLPKCRPAIIQRASAYFEAMELRHPCSTDPNFIPNDIRLTDNNRLMLLTGPNMGGKSTLLRQVCLAIILSQIGCYVPASSCTISPVDRIFTRLGANDNIMAGKSTFMVELLDTSKILHEATSNSMVILDELGRGTSTFDGMAIAHAVLLHLLRKQRPLTLFATHYRPLAIDCLREEGVLCRYMDCITDPVSKRVTFLYKLVPGVSPKSYGMNVAIMAGLPTDLIEEADTIADEFENKLSLSLESKNHSSSRILSRELISLLCPKV